MQNTVCSTIQHTDVHNAAHCCTQCSTLLYAMQHTVCSVCLFMTVGTHWKKEHALTEWRHSLKGTHWTEHAIIERHSLSGACTHWKACTARPWTERTHWTECTALKGMHGMHSLKGTHWRHSLNGACTHWKEHRHSLKGLIERTHSRLHRTQ